jgi:hypothetical protein
MTVDQYSPCTQPVVPPPDWLRGRGPYTPIMRGFERFLRQAVGLPAKLPLGAREEKRGA